MNRRRCIAGLMGSTLLPLNSRSFGTSPSAASAPHRWKAVQAVLDEFVRERNAPGAGVAISYADSEPVYRSAGTIAFDSSVPFDCDSICRVYSITKNVTRIATLLLVEDGKIEIDQPVATVLPEFARLSVSVDPAKSLESRPARKVMTMRHLITQTSGLGNWTPASDSGEPLHKAYRERGITPGNFATGLLRPEYAPQAPSMDEMVRRVAELPLVYEPGTVVHYSIGFDVMALVIERVTGMPYGKFLKQRLWGPLRMDSTGFQVTEKNAARLTTNYDATESGVASVCKAPDPRLPPNWCVQDDRATSDRLKPPTLLAGGGSLLSTSRDFLRYALMLLNEGALDGTRVMKVETARLATGNINPAGVTEPDENVGAGSRKLMRGAPIIPPGMVGAGGSTGTLFWIDKARRGAVSFMVQVMYGSPARSPFQKRLFPAIEADLATR